MKLRDAIMERRSVKEFDSSYKIDRKEMDEMLELASWAPSSVNLQPWRFMVVDTREGKEKLSKLVFSNTVQNDTSSAMVLVLADTKNYELADEIYSQAVEKRYMTEDIKNQVLGSYIPIIENRGPAYRRDTALIDSGLISMNFMLVAKEYGYDTNAIGGFDKEKVMEEFGLDSENLVPVMFIAIGKKAKEGHPSVRLELDKIRQYK